MKYQVQRLSRDFILENGGILVRPEIAYSTYGELNGDKSNVFMVCHALTANSEVDDWWKGLFGEGNIIDPTKYFVICINNLGSPYGSASPKSSDNAGERYGMTFPEYTIRDTAALHLAFLEQLKIDQVHTIIGGSCGGNIAQEIAFDLKERLRKLIIMCCSAMETPWVIAIHESQRIVLEGDSSLNDNQDNTAELGLRGARAFALPFYRSHPSFKLRQQEGDIDKINDFKAASYIRYQGEKFVERYDAQCYYKQLNALDTHNIGRNRGGPEKGLSQITAKTLSIGFSTDLLIPVAEQRFLAEHIPNSDYKEIETLFGHDAFLIETEQIRRVIEEWDQ